MSKKKKAWDAAVERYREASAAEARMGEQHANTHVETAREYRAARLGLDQFFSPDVPVPAFAQVTTYGSGLAALDSHGRIWVFSELDWQWGLLPTYEQAVEAQVALDMAQDRVEKLAREEAEREDTSGNA